MSLFEAEEKKQNISFAKKRKEEKIVEFNSFVDKKSFN